jgi:membrane-bound ClpP family serine protease
MTVFAIILLIFLGLLLLLIEFAVIPGVTIAGIGGFILLGLSVYIAFSSYGSGIGFLTLSFVLIASPLMIYYFFRSKTGKKMVLDSLIDGKVETVDSEKIHVGDAGITLGRLAPSGKVKVNGEVVEAQSTGGFVDHNKEIKVVKILTNKIIVEPVKNIKND